MQDIFEYTNYRTYLADLYASKKLINPGFSYRYIAQKAGFASPSFIGKILSGETNISHQTLLRLVEVFQLAGPEAEYFELMVYYDLAKTELDKKHYFQRMNASRLRNGNATEDSSVSVHSAWYLPPLLTLIELGLFRGDYADLGRMVTPPIPAQEARLGVELLMLGGYVRKDPNGTYEMVPTPKKPRVPVKPSEAKTEEPTHPASMTQLMATIPKATPTDLADRIHKLRDELLGLLHRAHRTREEP